MVKFVTSKRLARVLIGKMIEWYLPKRMRFFKELKKKVLFLRKKEKFHIKQELSTEGTDDVHRGWKCDKMQEFHLHIYLIRTKYQFKKIN